MQHNTALIVFIFEKQDEYLGFNEIFSYYIVYVYLYGFTSALLAADTLE